MLMYMNATGSGRPCRVLFALATPLLILCYRGAVVNAGSCRVMLPSNGETVVFAPDAQKYKEPARFEAGDTPTYTRPILDGRRIFVEGGDTLTLWTID
jgi:hypothetical protein